MGGEGRIGRDLYNAFAYVNDVTTTAASVPCLQN